MMVVAHDRKDTRPMNDPETEAAYWPNTTAGARRKYR